MLITFALFCLAFLIGGMVFFPAVVAPRVFKSLSPETAGLFLRDLFPAYYAYMIVASMLASLPLWPSHPGEAAACLFVALSTLWVRQVLMPRINRYRDAEKAGDTAAAGQFKRAHRFSVFINLGQLLMLLVVFGRMLNGF